MQSFQERFRTKSSTIGKSGELSINPDSSIQRPYDSKIHSPINSPVIKTIAKTIIHPSNTPNKMTTFTVPKYRNLSYKNQDYNFSLNSVETSFKDLSSHKKRKTDYNPYTIRDYYNIKPKKYYELGGLGSPTIGTEDWTKRKNISDKRIEYGKKNTKLQRENTNIDSMINHTEKIRYRFTLDIKI
ncbi:hypothetical protein SteCoe_28595 [Stentor coeruleus]|uniref:Uncharacterized protein n=1 Tax=Stentor coeruleus TaxID=5963 RepID=A0A1R2B866_9CILI|nr:hypothetical protein SteCoe_28595 [Stentor coeruleus]